LKAHLDIIRKLKKRKQNWRIKWESRGVFEKCYQKKICNQNIKK